MSAVAALVLCLSPTVMDGDTFRCANTPQKIRIAGIDAPDHTCRGRRDPDNCQLTGPRGDWTQSRAHLAWMLRRSVRLRFYAGSTYGRRIAAVCAGNVNVGAAMVQRGYARYMARWNGSGVRYKCPV